MKDTHVKIAALSKPTAVYLTNLGYEQEAQAPWTWFHPEFDDYPKYDKMFNSLAKERDQVGGTHYGDKMALLDLLKDVPFAEGNVIKYVFRHKGKNGLEDINKAIDYLNIIKKQQYGDNI
jgi:hypothetical protein